MEAEGHLKIKNQLTSNATKSTMYSKFYPIKWIGFKNFINAPSPSHSIYIYIEIHGHKPLLNVPQTKTIN